MRVLLTLLMCFVFSIMNSQNLDGGVYSSGGLFQFGITGSKPVPNLRIKGSQYFEESFKPSYIKYYNKKLDREGYMRYNAFRDEIEIASSPIAESSETALIKEKDLVPVIDGETYIYLPHRLKSGRAIIGYLVEIYRGRIFKIYEKRSKKFMEEVKARTGLENSFPPRYVDNVEIYISISNNTPTLIPSRKKDFLNLIPGEEKIISEYIKVNKLKINKLESVIQIFQYIETLN